MKSATVVYGILFGVMAVFASWQSEQLRIARQTLSHYPAWPGENVDVPKGHPYVFKDAEGFYWTEPYDLEDSCLNCHKKRWDGGGGSLATWRMTYWQGEFPDSIMLPENPEVSQ